MPEPFVQPGAIDAHVHVFDRARRDYPADAGYIPREEELRTVDDLIATLDAAGIARAVLVQPSGYGTDNSLIAAVIAQHRKRFAGVAVVGSGFHGADLVALRDAGIGALRINLRQSAALFSAGGIERLAAAAADTGLALHLQGDANELPELVQRLTAAHTIVLDHLGFPDPGRTDPQIVARLAGDPRLVVKLSGGFRLSRQSAPFADLDRYVEAILAAFGPGRCLWGSDWPFINTSAPPRYADTLATLRRWVPDPVDRKLILCDTPSRLFFRAA